MLTLLAVGSSMAMGLLRINVDLGGADREESPAPVVREGECVPRSIYQV